MEGASFQPGNPKTNGLSILYYNARSLLPKVDELAYDNLQITYILAMAMLIAF